MSEANSPRHRSHEDDVELGTQILDLRVPDQLRLRRSLGLPWLDRAVGGAGLVPSTVGMLTGMPGFGKSTLMRQLADSITQQGHIAVYNCGEESPYQVKMRVEEMGLKHGFLAGAETYVGRLLAFARQQQAEHPKRQVFLLQDSLQTLDDGHYRNGTTSMTPVRCCKELKAWAKETYGIALFVGQVTKDGTFSGRNEIRHLIDLHCDLDLDEESGCRRFIVTKNRFGPEGMSRSYALAQKGLVVEELRAVSGTRPKQAAG
jgi:DNA repair protein RadA/Sms